jgi:hypothetical protein
MDLIQQDLFGVAQERKEAADNVRYVKEAGGSKSAHSIEIISSMILFNPSKKSGVSAIHAIVSPLLERLRFPGTQAKVIRRIKESLSRVVNGLFRTEQKSPFVSPLPFVKQEVDSVVDGSRSVMAWRFSINEIVGSTNARGGDEKMVAGLLLSGAVHSKASKTIGHVVNSKQGKRRCSRAGARN